MFSFKFSKHSLGVLKTVAEMVKNSGKKCVGIGKVDSHI